MKKLMIVLVLLLIAGCGDGPTSPTPAPLPPAVVPAPPPPAPAPAPSVLPGPTGSIILLGWDGIDYTKYLGCLGGGSCSEYHSESVLNEYGTYGSPYSSTSINNPYSTWGSPYSNTSACNEYASRAPVLVNHDAAVILGVWTLNKYASNRIQDQTANSVLVFLCGD
jgi:hypothetical protein